MVIDIIVGTLGFMCCGLGIFALMWPHNPKPQKIRQTTLRDGVRD